MSSYVFISDHDHGSTDINKNLHEQPLTENGHIEIGDNVFIGVKSSILKNVTIGNRSVVAANAVVIKDVPPFTIVAGNPAKIMKRYDFKKRRQREIANEFLEKENLPLLPEPHPGD